MKILKEKESASIFSMSSSVVSTFAFSCGAGQRMKVQFFVSPVVLGQCFEIVNIVLLLGPIVAHFMSQSGTFVDANIEEYWGDAEGHRFHLVQWKHCAYIIWHR